MGKKSIVETSVLLTGDASGMVNEFKRADNESRRSAARIDAEVDKLTKGIKKKFSAADIGKDLLRGIGIGSGFAVAELAAQTIAGFWKEAAESAERIAAYSDRSLKASLELIHAHQTDTEQLDAMRAEQAQKEKDYSVASRPNQYANMWQALRGGLNDGFTNEQAEKKARLDAEIKELAVRIDAAQRKIDEANLNRTLDIAKATGPDLASLKEVTPDQEVAAADAARKALEDLADERQKEHEAEIKRGEAKARINAKLQIDTEDISRKVTAAMEQQDDQLANLAARYRDIADPAKAYRDEIETIANLERAHVLSSNEAAAATARVKLEMQSLDPVFRQVSNLIEDAGNATAAAWVDAANGIEGAWSNLGDMVIRQMEMIAAKALIIQPIMSMLGMAFSGMGMSTLGGAFSAAGTGHADGGRPAVGVPTWTGERGRELFVPDQPGRILTAGESASAARGGEVAGDTLVFAPQIAAGVTRQDLAGMMPEMMRRFAAYVDDSRRRRP